MKENSIPELKKILIIDSDCGLSVDREKLTTLLKSVDGLIVAHARMGCSAIEATRALKKLGSVGTISFGDVDHEKFLKKAKEKFKAFCVEEVAPISIKSFHRLSNLEKRKRKKLDKIQNTKGNEIWRNKWNKKIKRKL